MLLFFYLNVKGPFLLIPLASLSPGDSVKHDMLFTVEDVDHVAPSKGEEAERAGEEAGADSFKSCHGRPPSTPPAAPSPALPPSPASATGPLPA